MVWSDSRKAGVAFIICLLSSSVTRSDDANKDTPAFVEQFRAVRKDTEDKLKPIYEKAEKEFDTASTEADRERLMEEIRSESEKIVAVAAQKVIDLVRPHAAEPSAVEPLVWIVRYRSLAETGRAAAELLMQYHLVRPETIELAKDMKRSGRSWVEPMLRAQLAATDLPQEQMWRVMLSLAMCLQGQADVAVRLKNATEGDLKQFERRNGKDFTAEMKKLDAAKLEEEAISLFTEAGVKYPKQEIVPGLMVADIAKSSVFEIKHLGVGKIAPEIDGEDLDGVAFKLTDYRGKVVMLSFWGSWCGPCMGLVPHERELAELYKDKPFALIGVNSDQDKATLKPVLEEYKISWRSFWCGPEGPEGSIARAWNVNGWPTIYLIDHAGVIRGKQLMGTVLDAKIAELVSEAERAAKNN